MSKRVKRISGSKGDPLSVYCNGKDHFTANALFTMRVSACNCPKNTRTTQEAEK